MGGGGGWAPLFGAKSTPIGETLLSEGHHSAQEAWLVGEPAGQGSVDLLGSPPACGSLAHPKTQFPRWGREVSPRRPLFSDAGCLRTQFYPT